MSQDSNKFYILNYYISVYTGEESSMNMKLTNCSERGNTYIMTVEEFENKIEPIIIEYNRQDENAGLPDYIYDFSGILDIEPQDTDEYYNPETGEKIVI